MPLRGPVFAQLGDGAPSFHRNGWQEGTNKYDSIVGNDKIGEVNLKVDVVRLKNIPKQYPGVLALNHADLEIRSGEIHALLGENGAGKTTLM